MPQTRRWPPEVHNGDDLISAHGGCDCSIVRPPDVSVRLTGCSVRRLEGTDYLLSLRRSQIEQVEIAGLTVGLEDNTEAAIGTNSAAKLFIHAVMTAEADLVRNGWQETFPTHER